VKFRSVVRPEVDADLLKAETWYEQQQAGLGRNFLRTVRKKLAALPRNPFLYRVRRQRGQVRWAYPRPFQYRIIFLVQDKVVVYAVLHAARDDRHWKGRI
jgi:plasmid stabilization system protein ParE